jgi:hypothetical protein
MALAGGSVRLGCCRTVSVPGPTKQKARGRRRRHTSTSNAAKDRLDDGHDGGQRPLHIGKLSLDGLLLAAFPLQLLVRLGGLEVGNVAF